MVCLGANCSRTLHGVKCASITKGFAAVGCFRCTDCIVKRILPNLGDQPPPAGVYEHAEGTMLTSLTVGQEATGGSFAELVKLEREFESSLGVLTGQMVSPRDDPEVMKAFFFWLMATRSRALSLESLWRAMGSLCGRTRKQNVTHDPSVKAYVADLQQMHGEESHPRTTATRRMVRALFESVLQKRISKPKVLTRVRLMLALEVMCGLRVGEATGGGDGHGLLANHATIWTNEATGEESVQVLIEHSKTKHKRWINAVGESEGAARVPLASSLRAYWASAGFHVKEPWYENGFRVEGVDYSVLRVSLIGLGATDELSRGRLKLLFGLLKSSKCRGVREHAAVSEMKGTDRYSASGSMDKRYINVFGGASGDTGFQTIAAELTRAGFGDHIQIVPGPLIRATHSQGMIDTHMPLNPQSSYEMLHGAMDDAFDVANRDSPDPELDLQGLTTPRWGHHSFRRLADTAARQTMKETGATEQDIDLIFGWNEALYSQKMQVHYESTFDKEKRKNVTRLI